jgi:hypothetical protein
MNWRRGLFRLWIVGSALFVLAVAFVSYGEIKQQFDTALKPNMTFEVERPDGSTLDIQAPDMETAKAMVRMLAEGFIIDKPPNPWATLGVWAGIAFGVPLVVLVLGSSLVWAFSGFAAKRT